MARAPGCGLREFLKNQVSSGFKNCTDLTELLNVLAQLCRVGGIVSN